MKILLTGATGFIGKRLLPSLVNAGCEVICCVRDVKRFNPPESMRLHISVIKLDLMEKSSFGNIPKGIDAAFYLVHSMSVSSDYEYIEQESAINFREAMALTQVKQVVFLSGIVNENNLSKHLASRKNVESLLSKGHYNLTTLRAGIIIGSGSASFEIIRDLVEKLPIMIAPKWLNTKCQPIGISDVISILTKVLSNESTYNKSFDVAGEEVFTYKEMLLEFAKVRGLKRKIWTVPIMTPRISSYWLYFITSTSYKLAVSLVDSMKVEVVARNHEINDLLELKPLSYRECIRKAFLKIEQNAIVSSWKDSMVSGRLNIEIDDFIQVPNFGCFKDVRKRRIENRSKSIEKIWAIGGETGWYVANNLWKLRGFIDKLWGGVGLRRGRTNIHHIQAGDTLDFWRVIYADKTLGRLLLFAEMKLPGDAWLEFNIKGDELIQTATFRPKGLLGRLYWYTVLPFHGIIFKGLVKALAKVL